MKKTVPALASLVIGCVLLAGCAMVRTEAPSLYDFGPIRAQSGTAGVPSLPPIGIAEIHVPAWLDSTMIFFRLNYANSQQPRAYAQARWTMTPAQLLSQHLKSRIAGSGGIALNAADVAGAPMLRIEADDFTQNFASPGQSSAQVSLRASVFRGRMVIAQETFTRQAPAPSADAAGGASALATASDAVISDVIAWLGTLPLK